MDTSHTGSVLEQELAGQGVVAEGQGQGQQRGGGDGGAQVGHLVGGGLPGRAPPVTGCSTFDAALVCDGVVDASVDDGSDTHRLVDLAAALVLAPAAGCVVGDLCGRPVELDTDLTRRWSGVVAGNDRLLEEIRAAAAAALIPFG